MKKLAFSLIATLFAATAFTACTDEDDDPLYTYPAEEDFTKVWVDEYTEDGYNYAVYYTTVTGTDQAGNDSVYYQGNLERRAQSTGRITRLEKGTVTYSPKTGMSTIVFSSGRPFSYSGQVYLYVINPRDPQRRNIQVFNQSVRRAAFNAIPGARLEAE